MENRERDRVSQRTSSTDAGRIDRNVSEERGREQNSGSGAEFGQSIGRAENLSEGGEMRNRDNERNGNKNVGMDDEPGRRPGSDGFGSSPGGRSGSVDDQSSSISRDESPGRSGSGSLGKTGSSEGRH